MSENQKLCEEIAPYLDEIAEKLKLRHAAVMVGAGFSKNAQKKNSSCPGFPNWHELGDLFYKKVNGKKPNEKDKYLNALKLADEFEAAFGRPVLNKLLREVIPDNDYEPSPLHVSLLDLPWADIFTTNYDTLLERAQIHISHRRYDVVVNKEDLIYSEKPRIIKLHGSFPSQRPFVITEEDYRKYPRDNAPFVNTVQQSLIENTLCLIGFSGDDPNFLEWIGWIRDNLGQDSLKMYIIGIFNLSSAQKKLLEKRNIVLVDMSLCSEVGKSHYKAMEVFFSYLSSKISEDNRFNWPNNDPNIRFIKRDADKISTLEKIVLSWKEQRILFPGWVIVPEDRRKLLWQYTEEWVGYINEKDDVSEHIFLEFFYELIWRMEKSLCPILDYQVVSIEKTVDAFASVDSDKYEDNKISDDKSYLGRKDVLEKVVFLLLALMRYFREKGIVEKWSETNKKIEQLSEYISQEQRAKLNYEKALFLLFKLDVSELKKHLQGWVVNSSQPFWNAKKAGLLAEIGQLDDAEKILEQSLKNIRSKLNLKPISTDYSLVSQESFVMLMIKYVKESKKYTTSSFPETEEETQEIKERYFKDQSELSKEIPEKQISKLNMERMTEVSLEDRWNTFYSNRKTKEKLTFERYLTHVRSEKLESLLKKYNERWDSIKIFKCDPWGEIKIINVHLQNQFQEKNNIAKKHGFDIGYSSTSVIFRNSCGLDEDIIIGCSFLKFCEDAGIPLRIPNMNFFNKSAEEASRRIFKYYPLWAISTIIRLGDEKRIEVIFNRESLVYFKVSDVDMLVDSYLDSLLKCENEIKSGSSIQVDNFGVLLAKTVPEILSRLCSKCSLNKKSDLLCFLK
ncbi:MAG TPA: SIR2 family protein, partial [bacterium]|nr:SIR2 family protein [bacterium]